MTNLINESRNSKELLAAALHEKALRRAKAKQAGPGGLIEFIRYFWDELEPGREFVEGWALEGICRHLEAVYFGDINRLLMNVSPGFMKSLTTNVFFPAWIWGPMQSPEMRIVAFSYSSYLTERDNAKFRDLVQSRRYQEMYGRHVTLTEEGKGKVSNNRTGWKFASSIEGVGTGERGDIVILDDPHNVKQAESAKVRDESVRWFREAMQNRLNDLEQGAIVVIMQRVNEGDVSGCILDNYPNYVHFCVSMEYEPGRHCETRIGWSDPRTEDGELAWPERYPESVLEEYRSLPYLWAGQYQQRPEPRGGGLIKRDDWRIWDVDAMHLNDVKRGAYPVFEHVVASFDGAFTEKESNDYSALTVWGVWVETDEAIRANVNMTGTPRVMLIDAWRKRLPLHGTSRIARRSYESDKDFLDRQREEWGIVEHIAATCRKWDVDKLLIESKATGITVSQEMRRLYGAEPWSVQLVDPGRLDKTARVITIQHLFVDGYVWRPEKDWAAMVEDELASFPRGAHDDLVDTVTQALHHLRRSGLAPRSAENHAAFEERLWPSKPKMRRLYEA